MTVTLEQLQENVRAEDEEKTQLQTALTYANSYVYDFIHRDALSLTERETVVADACVMFVASDFYSNASGGSRNNSSTKYTSINVMLGSLRLPNLGTESVL